MGFFDFGPEFWLNKIAQSLDWQPLLLLDSLADDNRPNASTPNC